MKKNVFSSLHELKSEYSSELITSKNPFLEVILGQVNFIVINEIIDIFIFS